MEFNNCDLAVLPPFFCDRAHPFLMHSPALNMNRQNGRLQKQLQFPSLAFLTSYPYPSQGDVIAPGGKNDISLPPRQNGLADKCGLDYYWYIKKR